MELFGEGETLTLPQSLQPEEVAFVSAWVWGPEILRIDRDKDKGGTLNTGPIPRL